HVELVTSHRPVLGFEDDAGGRMHRKPARTAMTKRIDFRSVVGLAHEWIVRRHGSIVAQPHHFASVALRVLSAARPGPWGRDRHVEETRAIECHPRPERWARLHWSPVGDED